MLLSIIVLILASSIEIAHGNKCSSASFRNLQTRLRTINETCSDDCDEAQLLLCVNSVCK